jgi:anti-sigma B factor antagonist
MSTGGNGLGDGMRVGHLWAGAGKSATIGGAFVGGETAEHLAEGDLPMNLNVLGDDEEVLRLQVVGRVIQEDLDPDNDPLDGLLGDRAAARRVLLDLSQTDYIDSSGLALLLAWHKRLLRAGGKLVLHSTPSLVLDTIRILRMDLVLNLAKDESAALTLARGESG